MAGNNDDIDGKNGRDEGAGTVAPVPGDDAPSPIQGVDWQTFKNFLTRALNGDESVPSVLLQRVNEALHGGEPNLDQRDRQWWEQFFLRQAIAEDLRAIDSLIDQYNKMAEWHHEQAEKARAKMLEAEGKLTEIDGFLEPANELIDHVTASGKLDREKALRLLRERNVPVNGNEDDQALMKMLIEERQKAREEGTLWSKQHETASTDYDHHDEQERESLRKAEELVEKRDAIRDGDYGLEEEERRLREVTDVYEADVRQRAAEIEQKKNATLASSKELETEITKDLTNSQTQDEEAAFLASMPEITGKFAEVAANKPKEIPPDFTPPDKARPFSPVSSA